MVERNRSKRFVYRVSCLALGVGLLAVAAAVGLTPSPAPALADDGETTRGIYVVYDSNYVATATYCDHPANLTAFLSKVTEICNCLSGDDMFVAASFDDCSAQTTYTAQAWFGFNCGSPSYSQGTWDSSTDCDDCDGFGPFTRTRSK